MDTEQEKYLREVVEEMDRVQWFPATDRRLKERRRQEQERLYLPTHRAKLVRDTGLRVNIQRGPITTPEAAIQIFGLYFKESTVEVAAMMALNHQNEYLGIDTVATGTVDHVHIDPIEVLGRLWAYQASSFIIAHNHPSGRIDPSPEDLEMLKELRGFGIALNRPMRDFLIIAYDDDGTVKSYSHRNQNFEI